MVIFTTSRGGSCAVFCAKMPLVYIDANIRRERYLYVLFDLLILFFRVLHDSYQQTQCQNIQSFCIALEKVAQQEYFYYHESYHPFAPQRDKRRVKHEP